MKNPIKKLTNKQKLKLLNQPPTKTKNGKWISLDFPNKVILDKTKYNRKVKHKKTPMY